MANKNKTGLIIGLVVAGVAGYMLLSKKSVAATPTNPAIPTPGTTTASSTSSTSSLLSSVINLGQSLFGSGSSSSNLPFAPVTVQPTGPTASPSPAAGVSFINPASAPALAITAPPTIDTTGVDPAALDVSNLFL